MSDIDAIKKAAAPILNWWDAHENATPDNHINDDQCVMYYKDIRVTAKEMRELKRAIDNASNPQV